MSTVVEPVRGPSWSAPDRRGIPNAVLGTAAYVATAIMFFGGLVSAYLILRAGTAAWPPAGQPRLPVVVTGINTMLLLVSGLVVWRSVAASRQRARQLLSGAIVLGSVFLLVQGFEWLRLLSYGLRVSSGSYAATFYTIVGAHAVHALGGVTVLIVTARRVKQGLGDRRACALYWSFVVLLWPVLYVSVYLV